VQEDLFAKSNIWHGWKQTSSVLGLESCNFSVSDCCLAEDEPSGHFLIIWSFMITMSETLNSYSVWFDSGLKTEKGKVILKPT